MRRRLRQGRRRPRSAVVVSRPPAHPRRDPQPRMIRRLLRRPYIRRAEHRRLLLILPRHHRRPHPLSPRLCVILQPVRPLVPCYRHFPLHRHAHARFRAAENLRSGSSSWIRLGGIRVFFAAAGSGDGEFVSGFRVVPPPTVGGWGFLGGGFWVCGSAFLGDTVHSSFDRCVWDCRLSVMRRIGSK